MRFIESLKNKIQTAFQQGLTSCELATTTTIALLATTFPIFGLTTIAVTAIGVRKKLNLPLLIFISYSLEPLRYLSFVPLSKFGSQFLEDSDILFNDSKVLVNLLTTEGSFFNLIQNLTLYLTNALFGWMVLAVVFSLPVYYLSKIIFSFAMPKHSTCIH